MTITRRPSKLPNLVDINIILSKLVYYYVKPLISYIVFGKRNIGSRDWMIQWFAFANPGVLVLGTLSYRMSWKQKQGREHVLVAEVLSNQGQTWFDAAVVPKGTTLVFARFTRTHTLFLDLPLINLVLIRENNISFLTRKGLNVFKFTFFTAYIFWSILI